MAPRLVPCFRGHAVRKRVSWPDSLTHTQLIEEHGQRDGGAVPLSSKWNYIAAMAKLQLIPTHYYQILRYSKCDLVTITITSLFLWRSRHLRTVE